MMTAVSKNHMLAIQRDVREHLTLGGVVWCVTLVVLCTVANLTRALPLIWLTVLVAYLVAFSAAYRMTHSIGNYLVLFLVFHLLYGALGPLNVLLGQGMPRVFASIAPATASFLRQQILSLTAFVSAVTFVAVVYSYEPRFKPRLEVNTRALAGSGIILAVLSTFMYLINVSRLGGASAVLLGKAAFQSDLGSLVLTLPDQIVADVAVALFAIAYAAPGSRVRKRALLAFVICLSPLIASHVLFGQRGPLLGWLLIIVAATGLYRRYRFRLTHAFWAIIVYAVLSTLFLLRGATPYIAATGDIGTGLRTAFRPDNLAYALNPASNEFGGAFGNYSAFVAEKRIPYPQFGRSYLEAMAVPIPSFLFPGDKPQQIAYVFRDAYIPEFGRVTRISGTGFSSILEAYINFGVLGAPFIYALVGAILAFWEFSKSRFGAWGLLNYVVLSQLVQSFHRSSFGLIFGSIVLLVIVTSAWWLIEGRRVMKRVDRLDRGVGLPNDGGPLPVSAPVGSSAI